MTDYEHLLPSWADRNRWSTHQQYIAEEIIERFNEGHRLVVLNCPTGGGKTILGEMVRRVMNLDGIYLCTTLSLQQQFLRDFPDAKLIMGKANYTPLDPEPDHRGTVPTCGDCDKTKDMCSYCHDTERCPYTVARDDAGVAELACANTAYFMGSVTNPKSLFKDRDLAILDEAHVADQEVMRHVAVSISPSMQRVLNIRPPEKKTVSSAWAPWFEYAIPHITARMKPLSSSRSLQDRRRWESLNRLVDKMEAIRDDLDGWIYCYDSGDSSRIEFKPITTDKIAASALTNHAKRWLAMSATIIPEKFVSDMGWEDSYASVFAPSTFPPENRPIYFCPSAYMTKKNEMVAWPENARAVRAIIDRHPNERILVHTHAYGWNRFLHNSLENLERPVFTYQSSDQRQYAITDYELTENAVLLASSLEQGYDGKDELCRVVILTKVMYPSLGDKQVNARLRQTSSGEFWYASVTAEAIQQAVGRAVRHEEDHAKIYITDSMFAKFYSQWKGLFPEWFQEAVHLNSDARFEVRQATKELLQDVAAL